MRRQAWRGQAWRRQAFRKVRWLDRCKIHGSWILQSAACPRGIQSGGIFFLPGEPSVLFFKPNKSLRALREDGGVVTLCLTVRSSMLPPATACRRCSPRDQPRARAARCPAWMVKSSERWASRALGEGGAALGPLRPTAKKCGTFAHLGHMLPGRRVAEQLRRHRRRLNGHAYYNIRNSRA